MNRAAPMEDTERLADQVDVRLIDAATAARNGAFKQVLEMVLGAWGHARAPELAALVTGASAIAARGRMPIAGPSQRALHEPWLNVEADRNPADVDRLAPRTTRAGSAWMLEGPHIDARFAVVVTV